MLLTSWLLLRESPNPADRTLAAETAEAAGHLARSRQKRAGLIPAAVAAVAAFDASARATLPEPKVWEPDNHYTRALATFTPGRKVALPAFADDSEYRYYSAVVRSGGELPLSEAARLVYDAYTQPMLYRYWSDDAAVPPGMNRFDLASYDAQDGKLAPYRSTRWKPAGSRLGPQNMLISAWALQALHAYPGLYDERYRKRFSQDVRVDVLDPQEPDRDAAVVSLGGVRLWFVGRDEALEMRGSIPPGRDVAVRVHAGPDGAGRFVEFRLHGPDVRASINDRGESVGFSDLPEDNDQNGPLAIRIPYTVFPGQTSWANGTEHGRLSVSVGNDVRNLYFLSPESRVRRALHRELAGGIRTWSEVFHTRGYIPTSIGAGSVADRRWDDLSDTGGYAHLIAAMSQYLILQSGETDWQGLHVPKAGSAR
jgi:hypothetical protein